MCYFEFKNEFRIAEQIMLSILKVLIYFFQDISSSVTIYISQSQQPFK